MGLVGNGVRVWLVTALLISSLLLSSSRNLISENNEEMNKVRLREGRELVASVNDYDEPSANRGHDPPSVRNKPSGGKNTGRRG